MFEMILFVFGGLIAAMTVFEFVMQMFMFICDIYVKLNYDNSNISDFGKWIFSQYTDDYINSLKIGKSY